MKAFMDKGFYFQQKLQKSYFMSMQRQCQL